MIAALRDAGDPLFANHERASQRATDALRLARRGGTYPLRGRGDMNLYSLHVERGHALVRQGQRDTGGWSPADPQRDRQRPFGQRLLQPNGDRRASMRHGLGAE